MFGSEEIQRRFGSTATPPKADADVHFKLRRMFVAMAETLDEMLEDGRTKSVAFTQLEDASMWAHKCCSSNSPLVTEEESDMPVYEKNESDKPAEHEDYTAEGNEKGAEFTRTDPKQPTTKYEPELVQPTEVKPDRPTRGESNE